MPASDVLSKFTIQSFCWLIVCLIQIEGVIRIHNHHHTHIHSRLLQRGNHKGISDDVPSAGDGALNPWLYRFPPWFEPHNPPPPSLKLTNGEAAKSQSHLESPTQLRSANEHSNIYYDDVYVVDSHPFSDEVAKTVADFQLNPNTFKTGPSPHPKPTRFETESGFLPSTVKFRKPKLFGSTHGGGKSQSNQGDHNKFVFLIDEDPPKMNMRIPPHYNPKYFVEPVDIADPPLNIHAYQAFSIHPNGFVPFSPNYIPLPELPLLPLEGPKYGAYGYSSQSRPIGQTVDRQVGLAVENNEVRAKPELNAGFYPSKKPVDFSDFRPSPLVEVSSGRSDSFSVLAYNDDQAYPKSIQDIIRKQREEQFDSGRGQIEEKGKKFHPESAEEDTKEKWIWSS